MDAGESPKAAAKREVMEEVGAVLKGDLKPMGDISWVWNPEWADSPKRKKRYQQFQGEQVYFFTGEVEKFVKPTSDEGDAWSGKKLMKFSDAIAYLQAEKPTSSTLTKPSTLTIKSPVFPRFKRQRAR